MMLGGGVDFFGFFSALIDRKMSKEGEDRHALYSVI